MKKVILLGFLSALAMTALAQTPGAAGKPDAPGDTSQMTIADIIRLQERVTSQHSTSSHFEKVWGYKTYFNLSYVTSASLNPKEDYELGYDPINNNVVPKFKADFGLALQLGHSYNLLKNPIANMVNFNIDYNYINLTMTHYKKEKGTHVYDSDNTWTEPSTSGSSGGSRQYIPWCLSKFDINYGMMVGPSVTLAPFTLLNVNGLHFLKFNLYYHLGYQVGIMWIVNDKDSDAAYHQTTTSSTTPDPVKINWQHGFVQSFGFNVSWKTIGLGFETQWGGRSYQAIDKSTYGGSKYKFGANSARIYLKISY